jgi:AraC family transcriptional regulator
MRDARVRRDPPRRETSVTFSPASASSLAVNVPVGPAPMMRFFACSMGREFMPLRGDIDLTAAHEVGGFDADEESASLEVRIPAGFVQRVADQMELDAARARFETRHLLRDARLSHIAWALDAEQRAGAPGGSLYMDSLGVALSLQLLLSSQPAPLPRRSGLSSLQVQRVIDFVEANLDGRLSLGSLASVAGVSCSHLQRGFKSSKGLTVHRYVMSRRVERARALLMQRSLPASEVAFAAGFSHQSHMARWMRKVLGVTPRGLAQR